MESSLKKSEFCFKAITQKEKVNIFVCFPSKRFNGLPQPTSDFFYLILLISALRAYYKILHLFSRLWFFTFGTAIKPFLIFILS